MVHANPAEDAFATPAETVGEPSDIACGGFPPIGVRAAAANPDDDPDRNSIGTGAASTAKRWTEEAGLGRGTGSFPEVSAEGWANVLASIEALPRPVEPLPPVPSLLDVAFTKPLAGPPPGTPIFVGKLLGRRADNEGPEGSTIRRTGTGPCGVGSASW